MLESNRAPVLCLRPIVSRELLSCRRLPFVCIFANLEGHTSFTAFLVVGGSGEQRVGKGVKGRFNGVLNNADYEANSNNLHGDIVADAEQGAAQRNKKQGAAGNTGSTAGALTAARTQRMPAVTGLMAMPMVCAAAIAITVMVMAAPAMLMVAPSGMETE